MSKITDFIDKVIEELNCEKTIQDCLVKLLIMDRTEDIHSYARLEKILTCRARMAAHLAAKEKEEAGQL